MNIKTSEQTFSRKIYNGVQKGAKGVVAGLEGMSFNSAGSLCVALINIPGGTISTYQKLRANDASLFKKIALTGAAPLAGIVGTIIQTVAEGVCGALSGFSDIVFKDQSLPESFLNRVDALENFDLYLRNAPIL